MLRMLPCALAVLALAVPAASAANWTSGTFAADITSSTPVGLEPSASAGTPVFDYPSQPIVLSWGSVGGASAYEVQIATSETFATSTVVVDAKPAQPLFVMTMTDAASGQLYSNGTYFWRVRAITGSALGNWSSYLSFRRTWSSAPTGLQFVDEGGSPATTTSLGGYLSWQPVPGAASYDVAVMPTDNASTVSLSKDGIPDTRIVLPHLPDDIYTWRVRARDASGHAGPWIDGPQLTFQWAPLSNAASDVYPADAARTTDYRIGWKPVAGASYYQTEAATRPGCFWEPGTNLAVAPKQFGAWPIEPDIAGGWARYWDNAGGGTDFTGGMQVENLRPISKTWGGGAPAGFGTDFTAKFDTNLIIPVDGTYTLSIVADGGVRLWIDGNAQTDPAMTWADPGGARTLTVPAMHQVAGTKHHIQIEYLQTTGAASIDFRWNVVADGGATAPPPGTIAAANLTVKSPLDYRAYCRISDIASQETVNSWVGSEMIPNWSDLTAQLQQISDPNPNAPNRPCSTPAGFSTPPFSAGINWFYNCSDSAQPQSIYWTARPVASVKQANETVWRLSDPSTEFYGSWLVASGGSPFHFSRSANAVTATGPGTCNSPDNPTPSPNNCLAQNDSQLSVDQPLVKDANPSLQLPLLTWNAFPFAQGYLVQIATDANFNSSKIVCQQAVPASYQTSLEPSCALPDNALNSGYYWRVMPCDWEMSLGVYSTNCIPMYFMGLQNGYAKSFVKRGSIAGLATDLSRTMPLLSWNRMDGADHYEVDLAQNPFFVGSQTFDTTSRMLVPYGTTPATGTQPAATSQLADGNWYWRVRGIDRGGLASGWSTTATFLKRVPSPVLTAPAEGATLAVGEAVLRWNQVPQSQQYEVQWSAADDFASPQSATTGQTAFSLTSPGHWYWRARVVQGTTTGEWSATRSITVVADPSLQYQLSRPVVDAGQTLFVDSLLTVDGRGASGRRLTLQRKTTVCGANGQFVAYAGATTGSTGDEGTARFGLKALQNQCFRLAWSDGARVRYSAPFATQVQPVASVRLSTRTVRRGKGFFATVHTNRAFSGRVQFQYRVGKQWITAKTARVSRENTVALRLTFGTSGTYQTRVVLDQMGTFVDTTVAAPSVRVNDLWSLQRK